MYRYYDRRQNTRDKDCKGDIDQQLKSFACYYR